MITAIAGIVGGVVALLRYFQYRSRRDRLAIVRAAFEKTVSALGSEGAVERLSAAVLLRRFFDPGSEVGAGKAPYTPEVIGVMAAVLRTERSGEFQKTLADGLGYAPSLRAADLQRTNLRGAYLGARKRDGLSTKGPSAGGKSSGLDLSHADFFRAELSEASLRGADASEAVFMEARLHGTVLRGAKLTKANFRSGSLRNADLRDTDITGADFAGADLSGVRLAGAKGIESASFAGAKNLPPLIPQSLSRGHDAELKPSIFFSKPGFLGHGQRQLADVAKTWILAEGFSVVSLERDDYPKSSALAEIARLMRGCSGIIVFGFRDVEVKKGVWRGGTPETRPIEGASLTTPWCQVEAGMAAGLDLPILLIAEPSVSGGVFEPGLAEEKLWRIEANDGQLSTAFPEWCAAVLRKAHPPG